MEPRLRASPEQFAALVKFMERQGDLSKPQMGAQGRLRSDRLWLKLAKMLNSSAGGVEKTVDKWKKVWADWKTKTKKKFFLQKRRTGVIGNGPRMRLTALEQRVVAILGVNAAAANQVKTLQDFNPQSDEDDPLAQDDVNEVHLIVEAHADDRLEYQDPPIQLSTPLQRTIETKQSHRHSPPRAQSPQYTEKQVPTIPQSTSTMPRRVQLSTRRNLEETILNITAQDFVALEQRRLQLEETRERHEHEREIERLRLESRRVEVTREHNQLLQQLSGITNKLIDTLNHLGQTRLPPMGTYPK